MSGVQRFEEIRAWQLARELVKDIYLITNRHGIRNDFGLKHQNCRASVSIMSNIAEGFGRRTHKDFANYLDVSKASALEVQSLLYVAKDVGYVKEAEFNQLYKNAQDVVGMLTTFSQYLRKP